MRYTKQQAFDIVTHHLAAQGGPAMSAGACVYRAPDGRRCAIGALIPDSRYVPEMDASGGESMSLEEVIRVAEIEIVDCDDQRTFLFRLQGCHDHSRSSEIRWFVDSYGVPDVAKRLRTFAEEWGLSAAAVNQFFGGRAPDADAS